MFSFKKNTTPKINSSKDMTPEESQKYFMSFDAFVFHEVIGYKGWCHDCKHKWNRAGKSGWVNNCPKCNSENFGQEGYS